MCVCVNALLARCSNLTPWNSTSISALKTNDLINNLYVKLKK